MNNSETFAPIWEWTVLKGRDQMKFVFVTKMSHLVILSLFHLLRKMVFHFPIFFLFMSQKVHFH